LGALVVQRPAPGGPLIETLIGMALITQSLDTLEKSVSLQAKLAPVIANFKLKDDMAVLTIKYEYQSFKNTVLIMNNGQAFAGQGTYLTQPNQTVNRYAELMRQNVKASLTPCNQVLDSAVRDQQLITMRKEASSFPGILKPNLIGRILISTVASSVTLHKPRCEVNERIDALSS